MTSNTTPQVPDAGPDTIVLVHGLWMTPLSWQGWADRYRAAGYTVHTPTWPGMDRDGVPLDVATLRSDTSAYARDTLGQVIDKYAAFIEALPSKPIIMGHSFGGGIVQALLQRGLGAAGVAIDAAQPKGVFLLPASTIRVAWSTLRNPLNLKRAVALSEKQFNYAFTNNMTPAESKPIFDKHPIPGPGHLLFEGAFANFNPRSVLKIDFAKADRAPLLHIAGEIDHVVPASVSRATYRKYAKGMTQGGGVTAYKEFAGRTHNLVGQDGWEEIADFALAWSLKPTAAPVPA